MHIRLSRSVCIARLLAMLLAAVQLAHANPDPASGTNPPGNPNPASSTTPAPNPAPTSHLGPAGDGNPFVDQSDPAIGEIRIHGIIQREESGGGYTILVRVIRLPGRAPIRFARPRAKLLQVSDGTVFSTNDGSRPGLAPGQTVTAVGADLGIGAPLPARWLRLDLPDPPQDEHLPPVPREPLPAQSDSVPPVDIPSLPDLNSPAEVDAWLAQLASLTSRFQLDSIGRSTGGRQITVAIVGPNPDSGPAGPTVLAVCRQHGDEPAPTLAALELLREIATTQDPAILSLFEHVRLAIVPIANPDGAAHDRRRTAMGGDENRDWGHFRLTEDSAMGELLGRLNPDIVLDCHELLPGDYSIVPYVDGFSRSGSLLARYIGRYAGRHGNPVRVTCDTRTPNNLLHGYASRVMHRPAVLVESSAIRRYSLERRARLHYLAILAALQYACDTH